MFCSWTTDFIAGQVQCGEDLCGKCVNNEVKRRKRKICVTLFVWRALPRCVAPTSVIPFLPRISVVNVCVKIVSMMKGEDEKEG